MTKAESHCAIKYNNGLKIVARVNVATILKGIFTLWITSVFILSGYSIVLMTNEKEIYHILDQSMFTAKPTFHDDHNFLPRVLAFVFPQFHPDPLNDRLWGKNFTDWQSLNNAPRANRLGYLIPRPTDLGFYDYRDVEPRRRQGELARQYSIDGFIFHHYWFYDPSHHGPNLHQPLVNMLTDNEPNIPFCLHWCNSKWISTWNGKVDANFTFQDPGVLQNQYFPKDDSKKEITQHYQWLQQFFHHPNYIKVDGRPVFMLYQKKPKSFKVLTMLNDMAKQDGFPDGLYYTVGLTKPHDHLMDIGDYNQYETKDRPKQKTNRALRTYNFDKALSYPNPAVWSENRTLEIPSWCFEQSRTTQQSTQGGDKIKRQQNRVPDIAGIISSFDNTPRRTSEEAKLWSSRSPDAVLGTFRKSFHSALYYEACCFPHENERRRKTKKEDDDRFIIINAMNEWAEGMALEPSDVYGHRFLKTIQETKQLVLKNGCNI